MQVKKIFLASSEELKEDRRAFQLMLNRLNQQWRARDIVFDLVLWEDSIDAMSKSGLQAEYNKAAVNCDVFVMLFFTKVGNFTQEEFETVFTRMRLNDSPRIYTYFRNDFILTGKIDETIKSLLDFKSRLLELKHYVTNYRNTEELQYLFSRQLDLLYGDGGADSTEIDDNTPSLKVGEIALLLTYRHLHCIQTVDSTRLTAAIRRTSRPVRLIVYAMASEARREHWSTDKLRMERAIPVLEALTLSDLNWHAPRGQLGYALSDRVVPDWKHAKECLDRAIELRGGRVGEGYHYQYARVRATIHLDLAFNARTPTQSPDRELIVSMLKAAKLEMESQWEAVMGWPNSTPLQTWLELNESPQLI